MSRGPHGSSPWTTRTRLTEHYTEAQVVAPEPYQFGAASRGGDVEHRSFLSLSEDPASCSVVSFDLLDPSLRIVSPILSRRQVKVNPELTELAVKTPFCNETQMTACAEAVGTQWNQRADTGAALDMPIVHILVASKDVRSVDVNLDAARPDRITAVAAAAAPQARCTDFDSATHDRTDDASTTSPREQSQTVSSTWSAGNVAALYADTLRQVKLAIYSSAKAAMAVAVEVGSASDATPAKSAVPSTRQPLASKFIGTANKQLVGMATGLAVVLFIFVVWL